MLKLVRDETSPEGRKLSYVEGRVHKGIFDKDFKQGDTAYKVSELEKLIMSGNIVGKPIRFDHLDHMEDVGTIKKAWVDSEGWLNISAYLYNDSEFREVVAEKVKNQELDFFSIGYNYKLTDDGNDIEYKRFEEASLTDNPVDRRCEIAVRNSKNKNYINIPFTSDYILSENTKKMSENTNQAGNDVPMVEAQTFEMDPTKLANANTSEYANMIKQQSPEEIKNFLEDTMAKIAELSQRESSLSDKLAQYNGKKVMSEEDEKALKRMAEKETKKNQQYKEEQMPIAEQIYSYFSQNNIDINKDDFMKMMTTDRNNANAKAYTQLYKEYKQKEMDLQKIQQENEQYKNVFAQNNMTSMFPNQQEIAVRNSLNKNPLSSYFVNKAKTTKPIENVKAKPVEVKRVENDLYLKQKPYTVSMAKTNPSIFNDLMNDLKTFRK